MKMDLEGSSMNEHGLIAHWRLWGDARDCSGNVLHAENHGVSLDALGPDGRQSTAAQFDGVKAFLEVANSESLNLRDGDFSIALWVHTEEDLDNVLGSILSKYDPETRTGLHLSIDNRPGVTASQANDRQLHFGIDQGRSESEWTDHGQPGNAVFVQSMSVHEGSLFVGTCVAGKDEAGRVFRYDGTTWTDCGAPDLCNSVSSMAVYRGQLYVAVSKYRLGGSSLPESENPHQGGKVYRYSPDGRWENCGALPGTAAINGMVVFRGSLYAGSMYAPAGFFRYDGGTTWTSCGVPDGKRVESLGVYRGRIYASGYDEGAVYAYDGERWERLGQVGMATQTYGFAVYCGDLYVSEWPNAEVFRYAGGTNWVPAGRAGEERETMPLVVYNGKMYVGTLPSGEVYRFDKGNTWTRVARLDFTPNVTYRRVWSMAVYKGRLFAGTLPSGHVYSIEIGRNVTYDSRLKPGWRRIVAVRDGGRLKLYVDGRLASTSAEFAPADYTLTNDCSLLIGFGAQGHFNGKMSDLRIYNLALSDEEINAL